MSLIRVRSLAELQPQQLPRYQQTLPYPPSHDVANMPFEHWFNPINGRPEPFVKFNVTDSGIDKEVRGGALDTNGDIFKYVVPVISNIENKANGRTGGWAGPDRIIDIDLLEEESRLNDIDDFTLPPVVVLLCLFSFGLLAFWFGVRI